MYSDDPAIKYQTKSYLNWADRLSDGFYDGGRGGGVGSLESVIKRLSDAKSGREVLVVNAATDQKLGNAIARAKTLLKPHSSMKEIVLAVAVAVVVCCFSFSLILPALLLSFLS